jgi:molybdenum cofactor cytidylyltransferase
MPADPVAVAGILLAAGTSSRMGRNKMLVELHGESLLRGAAHRALDGGLTPLCVVLGYESDRAREQLAGLSCTIVINPDYDHGITSSLRAGVASLPPTVRATMVLLADMPFVTADMIRQMIARYQMTWPPLVISDYGGVNAPPMLYDRRLFDELTDRDAEGCGKRVVRAHRAHAAVLLWPESALADIDVPDDYTRLATSVAGHAH